METRGKGISKGNSGEGNVGSGWERVEGKEWGVTKIENHQKNGNEKWEEKQKQRIWRNKIVKIISKKREKVVKEERIRKIRE